MDVVIGNPQTTLATFRTLELDAESHPLVWVENYSIWPWFTDLAHIDCCLCPLLNRGACEKSIWRQISCRRHPKVQDNLILLHMPWDKLDLKVKRTGSNHLMGTRSTEWKANRMVYARTKKRFVALYPQLKSTQFK